MSNIREFFNEIANDNRIFTREDIGQMSGEEFRTHEKAIDYQLSNIGIPRNADIAASDDVVYVHAYKREDGTEVKAHYRSKSGGVLTGAAANLKPIDKEFNKPLNIYINNFETAIPNFKNYAYYNNLNKKLEKEVGDFLREKTLFPKRYSNDIRHQYVSAIYARNLGQKHAKKLGDLNEILHFSNTGSGAYDTALDQLNNEIGRNYAKKYPNISRVKLLEVLLNDFEKNSTYTENILNKNL